MIQSSEYRTSTKQRIVIAIIAAAMLISTAALYFGIMVSYGNNNDSITSAEEIEYEQLLQDYQDAMKAQGAELSAINFGAFNTWRGEVKAFNAASITELTTRDLVVGEGRELGESDFIYSAYYIGWLADETIFDSSFDDPASPSSLKLPLDGSENLIEGWKRGIVGMKIGGIREISIPAEIAYGAVEQGSIPANSPLKFIVMLIEPPEDIPVSDRLWELYEKKYGSLY